MQSVIKWVNVDDRLPSAEGLKQRAEEGEVPDYIVLIDGAPRATSLLFDGVNFVDDDYFIYPVTHWAEFPKIQKE